MYNTGMCNYDNLRVDCGGWREVQQGGDMCLLMNDALYTAAMSTL